MLFLPSETQILTFSQAYDLSSTPVLYTVGRRCGSGKLTFDRHIFAVVAIMPTQTVVIAIIKRIFRSRTVDTIQPDWTAPRSVDVGHLHTGASASVHGCVAQWLSG